MRDEAETGIALGQLAVVIQGEQHFALQGRLLADVCPSDVVLQIDEALAFRCLVELHLCAGLGHEAVVLSLDEVAVARVGNVAVHLSVLRDDHPPLVRHAAHTALQHVERLDVEVLRRSEVRAVPLQDVPLLERCEEALAVAPVVGLQLVDLADALELEGRSKEQAVVHHDFAVHFRLYPQGEVVDLPVRPACDGCQPVGKLVVAPYAPAHLVAVGVAHMVLSRAEGCVEVVGVGKGTERVG